jgi:hypothetical protein
MVNQLQIDPERAGEVIANFSESANLPAHVFANLAQGFVRSQGAEAAIEWLGSLTIPEQRQRATSALVSEWASTDPEAAAGYVSSIPSEESRSSYVEAVVGRWGATDPIAAMEWLGSLDPLAPTSRSRAMIIESLSRSDPRIAAEYLAQALAAPNRPDNTIYLQQSASNIASALTGLDPSEGVQWALSRPEGDLRSSALEGVARAWARFDPAATLEWAQQLAGPVEREAVLGTGLRAIPEQRRGEFRGVVEETNLPPEARQRILDSAFPPLPQS